MFLEVLDTYVDNGLLRKAETDTLVQYNYTERTNNNYLWDDITIYNRGNIYEKTTGNLVARAMPKFLNIEQLPEEEQKKYLNSSFKCTEKMDGCLGILYWYNGIRYNGRGSFEGFVVDAIKEIIPKYSNLKEVCKEYSLNVEVIHPSTKIIVDYGGMKELVLITAYKNGEEVNRQTLEQIASQTGMMIVKERYFTWDTLLKWQTEAGFDEEGFVLTFGYDEKLKSYQRVKVKSKEYLKVAAFRRNLNKHTLWKLWKNDLKQRSKIDHVQEYLQAVPDELYPTAQRYVKELKEEMDKEKQLAMVEIEKLNHLDKKELGLYLKSNKNKYAGAIWSYRLGRELDGNLIEYIEPKEIELISQFMGDIE